MSEKRFTVAVVGGGAAGMMAAAVAARAGAKVCLVEKNEKLGKKLYLTGKGRCNVTNVGTTDAESDGGKEAFFANIVSNPKFLYSAFAAFDHRSVLRFLEEAGCRLKVERGGRVFPVSDHSSDVIAALHGELKKRRVEILLNRKAEEVLACGSAPALRVRGIRLADGKVLPADRVILATGGLTYPSTGSDGDGYRFARRLGHQLVPCRPALAPLRIAEGWCRELAGLSLKNVSLRLIVETKTVFSGFGEMLFTHFGVSGPLVLTASSFYAKQGGAQGRLLIDLKPALTLEELERRLARDFEEHGRKQFQNALRGLFPARLIPVMVRLSGIVPEKSCREISRKERLVFARAIQNVPLTVAAGGEYREAVITQGGVSVKDVNPSTMESRLVSGLYFAGEVLDLDALTGGFNLQIAWSTGALAGRRASC
ncbi:MAG: NAD(P)/FAD-dependent oxidoreductase [Clostridium sp.]|jgi:predicted Rossmann fold flavoprotein|nr:NAD(P)/FAD-dependent oxidoreductase [Clostridium sp.]